jgi:hypothetical protein
MQRNDPLQKDKQYLRKEIRWLFQLRR